MDYLQNVMGYFDQQQPLCAEHDRISKDLHSMIRSVRICIRSTASRPVCATRTERACWRA